MPQRKLTFALTQHLIKVFFKNTAGQKILKVHSKKDKIMLLKQGLFIYRYIFHYILKYSAIFILMEIKIVVYN